MAGSKTTWGLIYSGCPARTGPPWRSASMSIRGPSPARPRPESAIAARSPFARRAWPSAIPSPARGGIDCNGAFTFTRRSKPLPPPTVSPWRFRGQACSCWKPLTPASPSKSSLRSIRTPIPGAFLPGFARRRPRWSFRWRLSGGFDRQIARNTGCEAADFWFNGSQNGKVSGYSLRPVGRRSQLAGRASGQPCCRYRFAEPLSHR